MPARQQTLFDTDPAPWQVDESREWIVATVVFPTGPEKPFDYEVPVDLQASLHAGARVQVPFGRGNRTIVGYCVGVESRSDVSRRLKPISAVVDARSLISPAMLRLTKWMADYYLCPWGQVLETVLPAGVRGGAGTREVTFLSVPTQVAARLTQLKLPPKQAEVLTYLAASPGPVETKQAATACGCTQAPIKSLRQKGLIEVMRRRVYQSGEAASPVAREQSLVLNPDQQAALDAITESLDTSSHRTVLVHGVTGSGKTEVYIQAIDKVVSFGRQAIVLVPEISLTPQTKQRFRSRFDKVAVLHSHMTDAERHGQWQQIASGEVQVVVGARSAVFAPTPHLGLIVLDEEHESTFKQDTNPRYHARDVALQRAAAEDVPLVLGSATPALESWYRAYRGDYKLVELPRRVLDRPMPDVVTVDLRTRGLHRGARGSISRPLLSAMEESLADGGQVILLLNRRGFSTHIQCPSCGEVVSCPHCDIALTHHRTDERAICHRCDYRTLAPQECPDCGFAGIRYSGLGTQRLEAEVRARFPDRKCLRMDTDSMQRPGSHEAALSKFRSGEVDILLGTQMIAKGLDFPNVTLVGVINADTALHLPDFRAAERTFHLVTQVAGRTGRGEKGGRVLVQTYSPEHVAIQSAARHDYQMFASAELPLRQKLSYPPFATMIRLVVRGESEELVKHFAVQIVETIRTVLEKHDGKARLLGPAPAPIAKIKGKYRYQIQLQALDGDMLRQVTREATEAIESPPEVFFTVDVDPIDML